MPITRQPRLLTGWARLAEEHGFDSLALLDRLAYQNLEPLIALSAVAGITTRIHLQTQVLLGPLRNTALLAKQVATLDILAGGRFRLGVGIGSRAADYQAAGVDIHHRGALFDRQLADLRRIWRQQPYPGTGHTPGGVIGPAPTRPAGPLILLGGYAPAAIRRVATRADGFLCANTPLDAAPLIQQVRHEWAKADRTGRPIIICQLNVAIGPPSTQADARAAMARYYSYTAPTDRTTPVTDRAQLIDYLTAYQELGADEVVLYCHSQDTRQIADLASLRPDT